MYAFATPPVEVLSSRVSLYLYHMTCAEDASSKRTSSGVVSALFDPLWRRFDVLALARNLRVLGVILHHVPRPSAAGCVDVLLDGGGDEVFGRGGRGLRVHVACAEVMSAFMSPIWNIHDATAKISPAPPRPWETFRPGMVAVGALLLLQAIDS